MVLIITIIETVAGEGGFLQCGYCADLGCSAPVGLNNSNNQNHRW